jgi:hypothetical protein
LTVTWNMALQTKNKFEGLGDIILRVMGQLPVPFSVEVTVPRLRHTHILGELISHTCGI